MTTHPAREVNLSVAFVAVLIATTFIAIMSLIKEPNRQKLNAVIIAGAGSVYWNGGLGVWEFAFGSLMLFIAFKGLTYYYFIGVGWLLHTCWDVLHHLYGDPIVYLDPSSSAGCAICDPVLAIWFFLGAPSIWRVFQESDQSVPDIKSESPSKY